MSRTYRRTMMQIDCNCGAPVESRFGWNQKRGCFDNLDKELQWSNSRGVPPQRTCECGVRYDYYSKRNWKRDRKNWYKPDKGYKEISRKHFRAKVRHEMNNHRYDTMPKLLNTDVWDWN